jgi:hypothetical protein
MRAHLVRAALDQHGVAVRVVTTSHAGRAFLASMGTPSQVLSTGYAVAFDGGQNIDRAATDACVLRYLLSGDHAARDLATLRSLSRGAALLVNDFHPLPLTMPRAMGVPVVHVYGTHLWEAIAHHFAGRIPERFDRVTSTLATALRDRAFGCIEHGLGDRDEQPVTARRFRLPSIVAAPARPAADVRASLGISSRQRLAAVYLNPHFRDPRLAADLERGLGRAGFRMHAVGEGLTARPGWRAHDASFNDVAAAADVLVSAPGMGALAAWSHFGTPLLALRTDQPEQTANLRYLLTAQATPHAVLDAATATPEVIEHALTRLAYTLRGPRPDPVRAAKAVHARWAETFCSLLSSHALHVT